MLMNMNDEDLTVKAESKKVGEITGLPFEEVMKLPDANIARSRNDYDARRAIMEDNPLLVVPQNRMAEANSIIQEPDGPALAMRVAKKAALAQYFAKEGQYTMEEAYEYFDQIAQKSFGRKMELNDLWNTVREIEAAKERPGIVGRAAYDVGTGLMQLSSRAQDIVTLGGSFANWQALLYMDTAKRVVSFLARKAGFTEFAENVENAKTPDYSQKAVAYLKEIGQENRKIIANRYRDRPTAENAVEEIASGVITALPDFLFGLGIGAATGGAGSLVYFGVGTFAGEWGDTLNDPNMSEFQKIFNATFCAAAEVVFERFGTMPLLKKYFSRTGLPQEAAKAFAGSIMNGFTAALKNIGIDIVKEGGSEAATGIVQRLTNTLMNKGGADIRKMSASQIYKEIVSPAWNEFAVGGVLAGGTAALRLPGAYARYKDYAEGKKALNTFLGQGNELARNLAAKDNPTDTEVAALDLLHDGMDHDDPYAVIQAQSLLAKEEFEKQQAMDQLSIEEQAELALIQAKELRDAMEQRKAQASEADIENSMRSLADVARDYAADSFVINRTVEELPEHIKTEMERVPERQRRNIEAFYDPQSGKVHLIAERITPSRAAKVAFHEVAVHKGLRDAMGDHFDLFIEKVQQDFADEIEAFRNSDAGQQYSFADDRELAEEWLAHIGETLVDAKDRSLLGRLVDALRRFLRKIPKFARLRYTQGELEGMILAASKNVRNGSRRFNATGVAEQNGRFAIDGKYFKNWQDVIEQFKKDLYGIELSQEQQDIYDVVTQQKDKIKLRINDLNELEDIFVNFGSRKKGVRKFISVHYAGLRNPVTALEVLNIGDVIRRGKITEEGTEEYPTSRRYELQAEDGATLKVIIDFNAKNDKNKSVINFYSDRKSNTGAHNVSSGIITDLATNIPQNTDNASGKGEKNANFSISPVWTGSAADYDQPSLHYVGSGEGAQVYGWGLYGSSARRVARWYAKADVFRKYNLYKERLNELFFDQKSAYELLDDEFLQNRLKKSYQQMLIDEGSDEFAKWVLEDLRIIGNLDAYVKNRKTYIKKLEEILQGGMTAYLESTNLDYSLTYPYNLYHFDEEQDFEDALNFDIKFAKALLKWLEENRKRITILRGPTRHLYKQTFWPDKEENLLDWDKPLTEKQVQQIAEQGKKENLPFVYEENGKLFFNESTDSGKWVYENLSKPYNGLGSPKAVSEFLYRAGIDGVTYIGESSGVRNYVAFSDKDIRVDEHIRFSMRTDETWKEMADKLATRIMPVIRDHTATISLAEEIKTLLLEEGFLLEDAEVNEIIVKAKDMLRGWQTRLRARQDLAYIYETDPWLNAIAAVYGDNFRIVPGEKYRGEEFDGTWINNKKNAVGIGPDEAARAVNSALGENISDDDIIDHFRDLKRKDILDRRREEDKAFEEAMKTEELLHDQEMARAILQLEEPLTDEFIKNHPKAAKLVRDTFPQAKDWESVRAGLQNYDVTSWQEGRRTGRGEYSKLIKEAKKNHTDIKRVQDLAIRYIKRNLPEDLQGAWLKRVAELAKFTTSPSIAYPKGRREFELQKLFEDLQGYEVKERIIRLADKYATKRNASGRPTAVLDEMQPILEQIRQALNLSMPAVQYMTEKNREKIAEMEEANQNAQELKDFNTILGVFGALEQKTPEQLRQALDMLEAVIHGGREAFGRRMEARREELNRERERVISEAGSSVVGPTRFEKRSFFKNATAKHMGLRHLLEWISEKSGKDFEDTWGGKMWRETEDATRMEDADKLHLQKAWDKMLAELGIASVAQKRAFMEELNREVKETGVFKIQHSRDNQELGVTEKRRKWTMRQISVKQARKLVADYDGGASPQIEDADGNTEKIPNYSVELLKRQLAAFDAGVDIMTEKFFGDPGDDAAFARFMQDIAGEEKEKRLVLLENPKEELFSFTEVPLTKDSAMHVWLSWQQKDVRAGMEFNGWSIKSIQQIEEFLGKEYLALAVKMRDYIRSRRAELDRAALEDYDTGLPQNDNYFPASYKGSLGKEMRADVLLGAQYGEMSIAPSFLIARKFHLNDIDTDSSAVSAFLGNQIEQAHYLAWRKVIREYRGVLNNRLVREAITQEYGKDVFDQLIDRIDVIAKGGRSTSDAVQEIAKFYKFWIPAKIALNLSSVTKQLVGAVNFINDIPAKEFFKGYAESFVESDLRDRFFNEVQKSDWLQNRQGGGIDKDLTFMLNSTRNIQNYNPSATYLMDKITMPTRWADTVSVLHGGYAVFLYHYNKTLAMLQNTANMPQPSVDEIDVGQGVTTKQPENIQRLAWDEAMRQFKRSVDETQQSGALKDQNFYQSQAGMFRYLTAFMTNPAQLLAKELALINQMLLGKGFRKETARQNIARMLVVNHLVMPILMEGITQFFRNGFEWDEYDFWDFLTGMLLGPAEAWIIAGKAVRAFSDTLQREPSFGSVFQALPVVDDGLRGVSQLIRVARMDKDMELDDWLKTFKALADLSMVAGSVAPGASIISAIGSGISAGIRETRRSIRLFNSIWED
jgi:hypothetical protein